MDWVFIAIGVTAGVVALAELRVGLKATKVQRVIELHRDFTVGEVGAACDRLTTLMWKHGERVAGPSRCYSPAWEELLANGLGGNCPEAGMLGAYPGEDDIPGSSVTEPMRDLFSVLWCFERIEGGRAGRALDRAMLGELLATHVIWWDELTSRLTIDNTRHIAALRSLAAQLETPSLREWAQLDFTQADIRAGLGEPTRDRRSGIDACSSAVSMETQLEAR